MEWHWNETTLEWIDKPGVKPYLSWVYNEEKQIWEAPISKPEGVDGFWDEENKQWL